MVTQRKGPERGRPQSEFVSSGQVAMTNLPSKCADIKNKFPERRMSGEVEEQNRRRGGRSNGGVGEGVNLLICGIEESRSSQDFRRGVSMGIRMAS